MLQEVSAWFFNKDKENCKRFLKEQNKSKKYLPVKSLLGTSSFFFLNFTHGNPLCLKSPTF